MRRVRLRDICSNVDYGLTASSTQDDTGLKFLRITDIDGDVIDWAKVPFVAATPKEAASNMLRSGDVVVARTGASVGRSAWVRPPKPTVFASYLVRLRADPSLLDSRFLGLVMKGTSWRNHVSSIAHGKSAQPNMSASAMAEFTLDLPELAIQRGIAEVLGALDDKIAANSRLSSAADRLACALARQALDSESPLGEVAGLVMGTSPTGATMNEQGEGIAFFQGVRDFGTRVPKRRVFTVAPIKMAAPGDVLISVRAPVGSVNRADRDLCIGRGLAAARSKTPNALFHALKQATVWESFDGEGTVFGSINQTDLRRAQIPWSSDSAIASLERELAPIESRIDQAEAESVRLVELRDTLLPHLMSGRISVRGVEKAVEEVL